MQFVDSRQGASRWLSRYEAHGFHRAEPLPAQGAMLLLHAGSKQPLKMYLGTGQAWLGTLASSPQTCLKIPKFLAVLLLIIRGKNALLTKARLKSPFNSLSEI